MSKCWVYFLFLVWFSYLIVASILLFAQGFLLNKVEINKNSTCISEEFFCLKNELNEACIENGQDVPNCLPQKLRVILLIIDAFRYDFALYDEHLKYPLPYKNKMPFINELVTKDPRSSKLYKFIADPPTTTMQRLKALTTGSFPTFIDVGSNFATSEIKEDNLINQLIQNKRNVVFLGDDTWSNLYPNHFLRSYAYPSFNVWDLDTVDIGINNNIYNELQQKDWSLLIGHYLGVDHCGHRYGPNHSEMARKLKEMNEVIKNVTKYMNSDTVLFVVGDHGMTATGDHGGESTDEITAALFVHSKLPLVNEDTKFIKQVDLVPTLSTILGVPIPYANLGTIIRSCLPLLDFGSVNSSEMASAIWRNLHQMTLYIEDYSKITDTFNDDRLEIFKENYNILKKRFNGNNFDYKDFLKDCIKYMLELRTMCEEAWVQFDPFSMTRGLLLCFIPVFFVFIIVDGIPTSNLSNIFTISFIIIIYMSFAIIAAIAAISYHLNISSNILATVYFFSGIAAVFILSLILIQNWDLISQTWYESSKKRNWIDLVCRFILLVSIGALFSNSFIIQECYVSGFLLITLVVTTVLELITSSKVNISKNVKNVLKSNATFKLLSLLVLFCTLIRLSTYYWQCREEQNCLWFSSQKNNVTNRIELIFSIVSVGLVVTLSRMWLRYSGNLATFNITTLLAQYAPTTITICCGGYWLLHNLPNNMLLSLWRIDALGITAYMFIIIGLGAIYIKPLSAYVILRNAIVDSQEITVPQLFQRIKYLLHEKSEKKHLPIVGGLGTIYSANFVIVAVYLSLLVAFLLGNKIAPSMMLLFFSTVIILCISSIIRYEKATDIDNLLHVPFTSILAWTFLSVYFFYGTGHQPTFPNIAWEAAFVGTGGSFINNYFAATLVLINTFGSYIIMAFMLPLLQIAPFTIYANITTYNKKKGYQRHMEKGDVILFENRQALMTNTFTLTCKYLCCLALRVFATMLSATIHCRHLMTWGIFAPKFIFEALSIFITIPSVLLSYILLIRVDNTVNRLIQGLNKER